MAEKRIAVVIGAGSVKCAASLGLLKVLQQHNVPIHLLVGCSAGGLYAAMSALGHDPQTVEALTLKIWTRQLTSQRNRRALLKAIFPKWLGFDKHFGTVDDSLIMARLTEVFGEKTFADCRIPLYVTATDFHSGEQVILQAGRLRDALRASLSIPFTFQPYRVGERLLIDGFMSDPLPVGVAIREGADIILAMGFESPYQTNIKSAGRFAFQMSAIMTNNLLKAKFAFHNAVHHAELITILPEFKQRIRLFDTEKIPQIIQAGEEAAQAQWPYLERLLTSA